MSGLIVPDSFAKKPDDTLPVEAAPVDPAFTWTCRPIFRGKDQIEERIIISGVAPADFNNFGVSIACAVAKNPATGEVVGDQQFHEFRAANIDEAFAMLPEIKKQVAAEIRARFAKQHAAPRIMTAAPGMPLPPGPQRNGFKKRPRR